MISALYRGENKFDGIAAALKSRKQLSRVRAGELNNKSNQEGTFIEKVTSL